MVLDLQFKIKENENYLRFLRENSYWYKYLNRDPSYFKYFEDEVKKTYKLTKTDKFINTLETIEMMGKVISTLT